MFYDLSNPLHAESFKRRVNLLYKNKAIVELTEKKPRRTLSQNAYLHAALSYFGLQLGYKLEEVKQWYFKQECNPDLFVTHKKDKLLDVDRVGLRSSKDLSTSEMTLAIERFRNWASLKAGVYIPSPDEHHLVMQMELEVERAKQFL